MKKDEIIQLLKEQLDRATEINNQLLQRIDALLERIAFLEEALLQKGESLEKQKRVNKGLTKIISNKSEKQTPEPLRRRSRRRLSKKEKRSERQERIMEPNVTCTMKWRSRNMRFFQTIPSSTSARLVSSPKNHVYASAMNVF